MGKKQASKVSQFLALFVAAALAAVSSGAAERVPHRAEKKLIEWGGDEPDPAYMRAHARQMDAGPFDGVVFHAQPMVRGESTNFAWTAWSARRFEYADFERDVADLKACRFRRLKHNFLRFNVCPGNVDWFDDEQFGAVVHNAGIAARVARESGSKGLMFDVEAYAAQLFNYQEQVRKNCKSFAEYEGIVRQRGLEFARALTSEYPDITILLTYAYEITGSGAARENGQYGLFKNFLDGLFEGVSERATIVHAYERAYPYRRHKEYADAYQYVRGPLATCSAVPELYRARVQMGFGVWLDMGQSRYGWHERDFERNYFMPDEFAYTLAAALSVTDRYVWVYSERLRWWPPTRVPHAYVRAVRRAKTGPFRVDDARVPTRSIKGDAVRAVDQPGFDEKATFGDLLKDWLILANLPVEWKFRTDPRNVGIRDAWFAQGRRAGPWQAIEIGRFWDEQYDPYHGRAWYRLEWQAPSFKQPAETQLALLFGAADETARVWVDGELVGEHDEGPGGWNKPFVVDVTGKIQAGKKHTLAVMVGNSQAVGGLWKRIKLASRRLPGDVTEKPVVAPERIDACPRASVSPN